MESVKYWEVWFWIFSLFASYAWTWTAADDDDDDDDAADDDDDGDDVHHFCSA